MYSAGKISFEIVMKNKKPFVRMYDEVYKHQGGYNDFMIYSAYTDKPYFKYMSDLLGPMYLPDELKAELKSRLNKNGFGGRKAAFMEPKTDYRKPFIPGTSIRYPRSAGANFKRLFPFLAAVNGSESSSLVFQSEGFMPLSVDFLGYNFNSMPVYGMMHYYTQNGDLMRDPDMTFAVDLDNGYILPLSFQQDGASWTESGTIYRETFKDGGKSYFPRILNDLDAFLSQWSKNILSQKFSPEKVLAE